MVKRYTAYAGMIDLETKEHCGPGDTWVSAADYDECHRQLLATEEALTEARKIGNDALLELEAARRERDGAYERVREVINYFDDDELKERPGLTALLRALKSQAPQAGEEG